jgi:hypothetical protein
MDFGVALTKGTDSLKCHIAAQKWDEYEAQQSAKASTAAA